MEDKSDQIEMTGCNIVERMKTKLQQMKNFSSQEKKVIPIEEDNNTTRQITFADNLFQSVKNKRNIENFRAHNINEQKSDIDVKSENSRHNINYNSNLNNSSHDSRYDLITPHKPSLFNLMRNPKENKSNLLQNNLRTKTLITDCPNKMKTSKQTKNNIQLPLFDLNECSDESINNNVDEKEVIKIYNRKKSHFSNVSFNDVSSNNSKVPLVKKSSNNISKFLLKSPNKNSLFIKKESNPLNRKLFKIKRICESDSDDFDVKNELKNRFIILPYNGYKKIFDVVIILIILYSFIVIPYKISFIDCDYEYEKILEYLFKFCLLLDLILNFFTAYIDSDNKLITDRNKIIIHYLNTWFIIDLLSLLPIWIPTPNPKCEINSLLDITHYSYSAYYTNSYVLFSAMELFRLLKLLNEKRNVRYLAKYIGEKLKIRGNIEKLFYFGILFLLLNHLSACFWLYLARLQNENPETWVVRLGYENYSNSELYILSFYWTLTTITTVGYGEINAGTKIERIYSLFIMCFGVFMYSFAIGSMSAILDAINSKRYELNQKLQILALIKKEYNISNQIYNKVSKVLKHDYNRNIHDKINFLQSLPNKLKIEMSKILYDDLIHKLYFFRDQPAEFVAYVVPMLKPIKFSKNDYLYKIEDTIDEIYLIAEGAISFCLDEVYLETEIKEMKKYNYFGEIEMCLNEKLDYNIKVKSRHCELYVLKKNNFLTLSVNYKEFFDNFMRHSLLMYSRFNYNKRKVMNQLEEENGQVKENIKKKNKLIQEENDNYEIITSEDETELNSIEMISNNEDKRDDNILNLEKENKQSEKDKEKNNIDISYFSSSKSDSQASQELDKSESKFFSIADNQAYTVRNLMSNNNNLNNLSSENNRKLSANNSNLTSSCKTIDNLKGNSNNSLNNMFKNTNPILGNPRNSFNLNNVNVGNKSLFRNSFKLNNPGNIRNSLANTSLNILKKFQMNNNENSSNNEYNEISQSPVPFIRDQIRKNTRQSFKKDSDDNEERNLSFEYENNKFLVLIDQIDEILERNKSSMENFYRGEDLEELVKNLRNVTSITERNEIIGKLQIIANDIMEQIN